MLHLPKEPQYTNMYMISLLSHTSILFIHVLAESYKNIISYREQVVKNPILAGGQTHSFKHKGKHALCPQLK